MPARPPTVTDEERAVAKAMARVRDGVLATDYLTYLGSARRLIRYLAEDKMMVTSMVSIPSLWDRPAPEPIQVGPVDEPCANPICRHSVDEHRTPDGSCRTCEDPPCYAYELDR